ncbi:MAG TPA: glycosyl hydrolase family 28-related protein [Streptosporangiaceae bacterium]|jgi:hypothetical protein
MKSPQKEGPPLRARRSVLTGGAVGLAAMAGAAIMSAPPAIAQTTATPSVTDWLNVVNYGADPTGASDSTKAINQALVAAGNQTDANNAVTGGVVYLPTGVYMTTAPLLIPPQVMLLGAFPASADMSSDSTPDWAGSVIRPSSAWVSTDANAGVIYMNGVMDGGSQSVARRSSVCNLWVDCSGLWSKDKPVSGTGLMAGLSVYGGVFHGLVSGVGIYNTPGTGMCFAADRKTNARSDGWTIRDCVVQGWGHNPTDYGIYWNGEDTQFINVHVQAGPSSTRGGSGWYINKGGNCRWVACRGDQSADSGWTIDANPGGTPDTPGGSVTLIGCGSENNGNFGLHLINTSATSTTTGSEMRVPVQAIGCTFLFDGRLKPTGGGAGIRVEGYNTLSLDNCNVNTSADGYPAYALVTGYSPSKSNQTPTAPALIRAFGGIWNCNGSPLINDTADMIGAGTLWTDVHCVTGGPWTTTTPIEHYVTPTS